MFNALHSKQSGLSVEQLEKRIKHKLMHSRTIQKICRDFEIDVERINDIRIEIHDLDDRYAETDVEVMKLNKSLFEDGVQAFFQNKFYIVVHEIVHFLSRIKEADAYFNDPEEVLGFVASVGYEMESGTDFDTMWNRVYPKISWHFHDEADAREFFGNMCEKAKRMLSK